MSGWVSSLAYWYGVGRQRFPAMPCAPDFLGEYAVCCAKLGLHARRNDPRDEFAALCIEAGWAVDMETGVSGPADVLVHGIGNSSLDVDFPVVHPLQPFADLAEVRPGKLARQVENQKVRARLLACRRLGWSFCPFVVEALGGWGGKATHLVQMITRRYALATRGRDHLQKKT